MSAIPPSGDEPIIGKESEEKPKKTGKVSDVAKKKIKPHEAEDATKSRRITRQASSPELKKKEKASSTEVKSKTVRKSLQAIEKEAISKKTNPKGLWEGIDRKPYKAGGYDYTFKLRTECDGITSGADNAERSALGIQKMQQLFPAIELNGEEIIALIPDADEEKLLERVEKHEIRQEDLKNLEILRRLGITKKIVEDGPEKGVYIYLPDREALIARWEELRKDYPHLPPLDIFTSEGIADDISFVEAFFTHDVVLSTGAEYVHDHLVHVIPTLLSIFSSKQTYQKERIRLVKLIAEGYRRILIAKRMIEEGKVKGIPQEELDRVLKHINTMIRVLGAFVDITMSNVLGKETQYLTKEFLQEEFEIIWEHPMWGEIINVHADPIDSLKQIWKHIQAIEKQFNALHPRTHLSEKYKKTQSDSKEYF